MKTDLKQKRIYNITTVFPPSPQIILRAVDGYRVIINGFEEYEFFVHRDFALDDGNWRLSEVTTGLAFPDRINAATRQQTINNATALLKARGHIAFKLTMAKGKRIIKNPELIAKLIEENRESK